MPDAATAGRDVPYVCSLPGRSSRDVRDERPQDKTTSGDVRQAGGVMVPVTLLPGLPVFAYAVGDRVGVVAVSSARWAASCAGTSMVAKTGGGGRFRRCRRTCERPPPRTDERGSGSVSTFGWR